MKQIHMILQGKGGVGKSFVASLLAQHYLSREITPVCIATDPINQTFAAYKSFNAHQLK
ncbi:MAG: conjugal transfer protein TraL, partial [Rhodospirillales bacterium]|nr:conjugal transfer protein TraL [Rhodospirillales bacterium]